MPNAKGKLSAAEWEQAKQWIVEKGPKMWPCVVCGSREWGLADTVGSIGTFRGGSRVTPTLTLFCQNCGHLRLFSAMMAGIAEKPESNQESETPAE